MVKGQREALGSNHCFKVADPKVRVLRGELGQQVDLHTDGLLTEAGNGEHEAGEKGSTRCGETVGPVTWLAGGGESRRAC